MKRKRYIKLLMGAGESRNTAVVMAKAEREARCPYAAGWVFYKTFMRPTVFTSFTPLMPDSLYSQIVEQIKKKDPAELAAELPAPGLWPKKNPHPVDALDALSYTALLMGRGNSRNAVGCGGVTFRTVLVDDLHDPAKYGGGQA